MATRRLPATPILLFQITVNHQTYIVYIHNHQCARETMVWEYKSLNVGINRFMLLRECVVTSSKQIVQQLPFGLTLTLLYYIFDIHPLSLNSFIHIDTSGKSSLSSKADNLGKKLC